MSKTIDEKLKSSEMLSDNEIEQLCKEGKLTFDHIIKQYTPDSLGSSIRAYGRRSEKPVQDSLYSIELSHDGVLEVHYNTQEYLKDRDVEIDHELTLKYWELIDNCEDEEEDEYEYAQRKLQEYLETEKDLDLYLSGSGIDNTYNAGANVSHGWNIDAIYHDREDDYIYTAMYAVIRVHLGADVRGNYSYPIVVKVSEHDGSCYLFPSEHEPYLSFDGDIPKEIRDKYKKEHDIYLDEVPNYKIEELKVKSIGESTGYGIIVELDGKEYTASLH